MDSVQKFLQVFIFILTIARNDHIFRMKIGFHKFKYLQLDTRFEKQICQYEYQRINDKKYSYMVISAVKSPSEIFTMIL